MKKFLINILSPIIVPVLVGLIIYTDVYAGSILGITQGGTGLSNIPQGTILYGSSTDQQLNSLNIGTSGKVLTSDGSIPNWASSSVAWGLITGTLSSQTDLQNALDTKLSTSSAGSTYVPYTGAINNLNLGTFDISAATSSLTKLIVSGTSTFPGGIWQGAGNVGIGTTTPAYGLDVETGSIKINNNITGAGSSGKIYLGDGSFTKNFGSAWSFAGGLTTSNAFSQTTSASTNSFAGVTNFTHTPISLTTSGNVGIGTTTPNQILSVVGNGLFSGSLAASNLLGTWQGYNPVDFLASTTPYTPTSRTLTINGTTYDLTANRSWTVAGGSGATTTINGVDGPTFTFATSSDTNIGLTIATSSGQLLFTPTWIGTLADARITNSSNWNTAYSDRLKWDGGATDLVAATGRTSLGLGTIATFTSTDYLASTTPWKGWTDFSNTATGLTYNNTTGATSLTSGYNIPLIASTSNWNGFWDTPSTRITAGTNLSWSGNTLNATGGSGGGLATTSPFTSGYIPFATSTLFLTDSPISVSGNNIGIGTTTANKLSVNGRGYFSDGLNVGYNNNNSGVNAVTLGAGNTATGDQSVAIGYETTASGNLSFALGYGTRAVGAESMAFGDHGYASGDNSIAFGEYSTSTADNTVTFGFQTKALVNNSIAMGFGSQALNVFTLAIGDNTIASGTDAFSSGYHTIASGSHSASFGDATLASGLVSFASGFNTNAGSLYSSAFGQWNVGGGSSTAWVETDSLFEIGNGWDISNKRNAFAVLKNGNASVQGIFTASNLLGTWQGYNPVDFLASSTAFIANNSGNWAGTITNGVYTNAANSFSLINPLTTISESWIGPASTTGIYFKANNVGIGNINPAYKLDIIGDLRVATNGIGELFSTFKGANADGYNIWLGNSGQSSLGTTTATYKGSYNTSIGHDSLYSITTGYNNIGLGFGAGRYITGGATANQTSNNSVYLGHNTKASVDGNANEIVIGSDATGNGSNSITLGSTTILTTILRGAVGVGITNPSALINIQQSAASENLFLIKSQYNDTLFSIDQYGNGSIRSSGDSFGASFGVGTYYAANKGIVVRGYASQTSNLQEWQNSTGQVLSAVTDIGYHVFWNGTNYTCLHFASNSITPIYATSTSATCD